VSNLEDEISRVMAEHDDEAPRAAELLRLLEQAAAPRRRRTFAAYLPFAAAAAVVAVVLGSVWAVGLLGSHRSAPTPAASRIGARTALSCPARYAGQAPWVPARPSGVGVGGGGGSRLVPQKTPSSALICAYGGSNTAAQQAGWALSGRRSLTGGLTDLAGLLTWQPRRVPGQEIPCTDMGGRQTNYLIGLSYSGGATIWVSATDDPNACVGTTNGEFASSGVVGAEVSTAFTSGRWPAPKPASCHPSSQDLGRLGQDTAMVPAGSTSLTICASKDRTLTSGYQGLVTALNQLPTRVSSRGCSASSGGPESYGATENYELLFSYPQGPQVAVNVISGCIPAIDSLYLQANSASSIVPILQQLLKPT
jgi:hypothetical protein